MYVIRKPESALVHTYQTESGPAPLSAYLQFCGRQFRNLFCLLGLIFSASPQFSLNPASVEHTTIFHVTNAVAHIAFDGAKRDENDDR